MKKIAICLILLAKFCLVSGQRVEDIRFIYLGEQLHPTGTAVVCIGKLVKPDTFPWIDSIWGRSILTDEKTFDSIRKYVFHSNLATKDREVEYDTSITKRLVPGMRINIKLAQIYKPNYYSGPDYYEIDISTGDYVYVWGKNYLAFMNGLTDMLERDDLDKNVVKFFGGNRGR